MSQFYCREDELTALSKEKRIVFVIDEYPYLAKAKPAISAMLQHIIDHKWTESRMYLILCGSSMSFMESQVLGKGNNYHYYIFSKGGFTDGLLQAQERGEERWRKWKTRKNSQLE